MPINFDVGSIYAYINIFDGLKPRAIFGTILELLPMFSFTKEYSANILRIISIIIWIYCINKQLYLSVFKNEHKKQNASSLIIFFLLSFIFSLSPITLLNLSAAGFIDAFPYAIIAYIVTSNYLLSGHDEVRKVIFINLLLVIATLSHEKTIFDIAILLVWFTWNWGIRKALWYFSPALIISIAILFLLGDKVASGETPLGYFSILSDGFNFFWEQSFNIYGIILGGGVFGLLYFLIAASYLTNLNPHRSEMLGLITILLMLLICASTLLIAHDTNRMIALIWLPLILIIKDINLYSIFYKLRYKLLLFLLCFLQAITPPMLIYRNGMTGLNCYGLWVSQLLPGELFRQKSNEQFAIYRHYRPDLTESFINTCNDDSVILNHIVDQFSKDDLKSLLIIYDPEVSKNTLLKFLREPLIKFQKMDLNHSKIDVKKLPSETKRVILMGSDALPQDILNQYYHILFRNRNIIAAEITSFRGLNNLDIDFTQRRWQYMTQQGLFSPPENWGAWSISKEVVLSFSIALPKQFELVIDAKAFGPNIGNNFILSVGKFEIPFKLSANFSEYRFLINNLQNLNQIKILVPNPTSPRDINLSDDHRKLGIALKTLEIKW